MTQPGSSETKVTTSVQEVIGSNLVRVAVSKLLINCPIYQLQYWLDMARTLNAAIISG